jgi:YYY domain-containing protein
MTFWEGAWAFLRWWACTLIIALAAWPIVHQCLKRLPDRGFAFARMFGLIGVGYFFWLGCWLHLWPNIPGAAWLCAAALLVAGQLLSNRSGEKPWHWLREHWKEALFTEGLFLVLFAVWTWVRANNPQGDWAEKPMEIAFINSIMRSPYFPANDPWLSGYAISYYHFGYIMTGMLAKMAALTGNVAFNLAVAASFGMVGCGSFGILRNLLILRARAKTAAEEAPPQTAPDTPWRKAAHAGAPRYLLVSLLAPFCVLFLGNLEGFLDILYYHGVGWEDGQGQFWKWLDLNDRLTPPTVQTNLVPNSYLWWWQASRVVNDRALSSDPTQLGAHYEVIDEFPAFTYVMGDLHPHVLAFPFLMAVLAVVLEILLRGSEGWPEARLERWMFVIFVALSIGSMAFLNTWDVLIFGMAAIAGWVGWKVSRKEPAFGKFSGWKGYAARWVVTGVLAVAFIIPFLIGFSSQAGGILPNVIFPTKGIQFFIMFGTLLIPLFFWVGLELHEKRDTLDWKRALTIAGAGLALLAVGSLAMGFILVLNPDILNIVAGAFGGYSSTEAASIALLKRISDPAASLLPALLIFASLAITLGWVRKRNAAAPQGPDGDSPVDGARLVDSYAWILIFWGALLVLFPEYFYLKDGFGNRMNTVFKFYFQGWAFWSLAVAYAVIRMFQILSDQMEKSGLRWSLAAMGTILSVGFFALGAAYLPMAVWSKTGGFHPSTGPTLDASAYLKLNYPDDAAAIDWINANIRDQGPIAEATKWADQYSEFARIATFTGIPDVIGWAFHEGQWRGTLREVGARPDDIDELYRTTDWSRALEILDKYGIRYVYFGTLETNTYSKRGLDKFLAHMDVIYQTDQVIIFERKVP